MINSVLSRTFGKLFRSSLACVCLSTLFISSGCFMTQPESAEITGTASSVTIASETQKPRTPAKTTAEPVAPIVDPAPYKMPKGHRDPFVPFGGNRAPASTMKDKDQLAAKAAASKSEDSEDGESKADITVSSDDKKSSKDEKETITEIPVRATGTMTVGGTKYAILTSTESGGTSVTVSTGERVGEYFVDSISGDSVVLIWKGKSFKLPIKADIPTSSKSSGSKAGSSTSGGPLPAPVVKEVKK